MTDPDKSWWLDPLIHQLAAVPPELERAIRADERRQIINAISTQDGRRVASALASRLAFVPRAERQQAARLLRDRLIAAAGKGTPDPQQIASAAREVLIGYLDGDIQRLGIFLAALIDVVDPTDPTDQLRKAS